MRVIILLALLAGLAGPAFAEGERAGDFAYYVMSLSWSADWCALEGDARGDAQCAPGRGLTFVLHGLWPQAERGYPSYCRTAERDPGRAETAAMADVMGSPGLAWYQWKKHGRCSGLSPERYFATARAAFRAVTVPPVFAGLKDSVRIAPKVVEDAFLEANPGLTRDMVTISCDRGMIQEARICLTKDLRPRPCGADVVRDCSLPAAQMDGVR